MARLTRKRVQVTVGVILAGALILNWQSLLFASAAATSDKRPALLRDADWNHPATARAFQQRFRRGSSEAILLEWLRSEAFTIDGRAHEATRKIGGLPCDENVTVTWVANRGIISKADASVTEAGCL